LTDKWSQALTGIWTRYHPKSTHEQLLKVKDRLTPTVEGSRLLLQLRQADGSLPAALEAIEHLIEPYVQHRLRQMSASNLARIALAIQNYFSAMDQIPPAVVKNDRGQPLYSWRVSILPYLDDPEASRVYNEFHLDEPWDSPHNRKLIAKMPEVFRCPASNLSRRRGLATYRIVVGKDTVFPPEKKTKFKDITDGTSRTIMVAEVADEHAVIWTKPDGLAFDLKLLKRALGGQFPGGFYAAFCDGSVRFIADTVDPEVLKALFTRNGAEFISSEALSGKPR
jgi:hypothetical protein